MFQRLTVPVKNDCERAPACLSIHEQIERKITALATYSQKLMSMLTSTATSINLLLDRPLLGVQRICFLVLKWGPTPKHIAFIMDGNRRYAKKLGAEQIVGHQNGYSKLNEVLQFCIDLNVSEITLFAFSIENFKRSEDEVNKLMDLAREKLHGLIADWSKLKMNGISIRVIGNLTLLPKDLIMLMLIAMLITKDNKRIFLNVAFSYTSREEMCNVSSQIIYGIRDNKLSESEISENLFEQCLYSHCSPLPEMIVRTSGEHRLSDFLMWQSSFSYLHFANVLWPEFSSWNFMSAVFCYQHCSRKLAKPSGNKLPSVTENLFSYQNILHEKSSRNLQELCNSNGQSVNWEKLKCMSSADLYEYYETHFKV